MKEFEVMKNIFLIGLKYWLLSVFIRPTTIKDYENFQKEIKEVQDKYFRRI